MEKKLPEILNKRTVAQSRLFHIEEVELRFSNGEERYYERFKGPGAGVVLVVPFLDDETMLLIREYAVGIHAYQLGFPKGGLEEGEDILTSANRELKEEIGYGARDLQLVTRFVSSPGYQGSYFSVVVARDLYEERLPGDEPEPLEVVPWSLQRIPTLVRHEEFIDARSIAALLLVTSGTLS